MRSNLLIMERKKYLIKKSLTYQVIYDDMIFPIFCGNNSTQKYYLKTHMRTKSFFIIRRLIMKSNDVEP